MIPSTSGAAPAAGGADSSRRRTSALTVNRKVTLSASLVVVLGFLVMAVISIEHQKSSLYDLGNRSVLGTSELLAESISGGLRWNRPEAVEAAYLAFATRQHSSIASIMTFDQQGALVTRFDSEALEGYDLRNAPVLSAGAEDGRYLAAEDGHIVVAYPVGQDDAGNRLGTLAIAWSTDRLDGAVKSASWVVLLASLAFVIVIVSVLAVLMSRIVGRPLAAMTAVMGNLARGNHDVEVRHTEKGDDIGDIARAVNVFKENALEVERLRNEQVNSEARAAEDRQLAVAGLADNVENKVRSFVESINLAVSEMRETAQSMSAVAELASERCSAVSESTGNALAKADAVAQITNELSDSSQEISRQVSASNEIVSGATEQAIAANRRVEGLVDASHHIGEVIELISAIAEQTNLLALNATIEAARAGDAGKGFAVVAGEVKSLANQTAKATEDISQQVAAIQEATGAVAHAIKAIGGTIEEINSITGAIAGAVDQQGTATRAITTNVQEVTRSTEDVSSTMADFTQASEESDRAAAHVMQSAARLGDQSDALKSEIDVFIGKIRTG